MKKAVIYLHIFVFLAGFTGVLGRLISLNEGLLVWYRMGITSVSLFLLLLLQKRLIRLPRKEILQIAMVGFLVAMHWLCFFGSIKTANVSIALVCFSASSFFSAILEPIFLKRRFSLLEIVFSLVAIAGIYIIMHFDKRYTTGIIFGTIAAVLSSLFTIFNKRLVDKYPPRILTLYELGAGFFCLSLCLPLYFHLFHQSFSWPTFADWGYLLILSWACTILAFILSIIALKKLSAFTVNLSLNLEPVYGILLAFLIFHENEHLHTNFYIGFGLIMLSVLLQTITMIRRRGAKSSLAL